ncbi:MAG TPA: hypothetical protein VHO70_08780 [Chitinispirillaceae bacterium]|nr:hypothetical protein [Chitinispirillaceae bacterium]
MSKYSFFRPAIVAGLFFFLSPDTTLRAAEFSLYSSCKSIATTEFPDLLNHPDSSQVIVATEYKPILFELRDSTKDNYNTHIHSVTPKLGIYLHKNRFDFFAECTYSGFSGMLRDDEMAYSFEYEQHSGNIVSGFLFRVNNFTLGAGIGRMVAESLESEHRSTVTDSTGEYMSKSPWLVACAGKIALGSVALSAGVFAGPVHCSISKIVNRESDSYRNFPVYLLKRNLRAGIEGAFPRVHFSVDLGFDVFRTADMITVSNAMPQDIEVNAYKVQGMLWMKTSFTDSLFFNTSGSVAGGTVASYNFSRERMTMLESDSLMIRSGNVLCGMKLPLGLTAGIAATRAHCTMPSGYLRLSAFSNWSVFKPMDYRFSDVSVAYSEMGLFGNRTMQYKSVNFCPEIALSYIKVNGECIYERKKIVVMFPVYGDTVQGTFINSRILCITPDLKAGIHIGKINIRGSLSQKLPIELKKREESNSSRGTGSSTVRKKRFYGGSTLAVCVIRYF